MDRGGPLEKEVEGVEKRRKKKKNNRRTERDIVSFPPEVIFSARSYFFRQKLFPPEDIFSARSYSVKVIFSASLHFLVFRLSPTLGTQKGPEPWVRKRLLSD